MISCFTVFFFCDGSLFKERTCVKHLSSCVRLWGGEGREGSRNNLPCREQKVRGRKLITGHLQDGLLYF